jgi:hypothetical protein
VPPQPLSKVLPKDKIRTLKLASTGFGPMQQREHLASCALEAIASWANVDYNLTRLFIELCGGNESDGGKAYRTLVGDKAKSEAIAAAAAVALKEEPKTMAALHAVSKQGISGGLGHKLH